MNGRRGARLFFVFFLFCSAPAWAAEVLRIQIPAVVRIEGEACELSEIASIEGPRTLAERVRKLLLSSRDGVITREQVIAALKVSGAVGGRIELKMPPTVTVMIGEAVSGRIEETERDLAALVKSLAAWNWDVEVSRQGSIPNGRLVAPASLVPGAAAATLRFRDASGRERSLAVRLVWSQPALVLTRSVKKGEVLRQGDFIVRQIRVNRPGVYASVISEAAGRSLKKNLSQGEPVPLDLIADVLAIERGKRVSIVARDAGLLVKAPGEALENGALGDSIKVRNLSSKTVVTAVVVAVDTVEVRLQ
ncbi:MAG: flagellar basal body P-ring formation chaperone FlgA [Synergistaceae bacterium]|jgi:flagella basal body P-ring formation protein FlgA|nr:flagellar basal body P-ring formation chaperone FlgA [Synergistaceae bacterium]